MSHDAKVWAVDLDDPHVSQVAGILLRSMRHCFTLGGGGFPSFTIALNATHASGSVTIRVGR